jgi:hypothetical protein
MGRIFKESWRTMLVGAVIAVISIASVAGAANLITGKDVKNGTLKSQDLANSTVKGKKLSEKVRQKLNKHAAAGATGATGQTGATGSDGATGATGQSGVSPTYQGPNWGVVDRNTIGSPVADLRAGPFDTGPNGSPPSGDGSLGIEVGDPNSKVAFGDEVDFVGDNVSDLSQVGFQVYNTKENRTDNTSNSGAVNMPSIGIEINPNGAGGTTTSFSTMVFSPTSNSPDYQWSSYIDGTDGSQGLWGLTGGQFNSPATQANCGLNGPRCTFAQMQAFLATGSGAKMGAVQITKGRDYAWQGAVDDLRINGDVFNFEPFGVITQAP